MSRHDAWPIRPWLMAVAVLATAWHAPGQLSFDSVIALHEASTGQASGWTPTFQSALLAWLGGGEVASALHVALMIAITVFSFEAILRAIDHEGAGWRFFGALMVLNPLIWLMVGVVWRDVLLGVAVLAGSTALLVPLRGDTPSAAWKLWVVVAISSAVAVLARQQGFLLAAALMLGLFAKIEFGGRSAGDHLVHRLRRIALCMSIFAGSLGLLQHSAARTIEAPTPRVATMDGWRLIMLYDIAGMLAHGDLPATVAASGLSAEDAHLVEALRNAYSSERIDGVLAVPGAREWAASQGRRQLAHVWWTVLRESPAAYVAHRSEAAWALLGGLGARRCLPGYWGVAGPPMLLDAMGMHEAMDARDREIGRVATAVAATPWLWNGTYVVLLMVVLPPAWRRRRRAPEHLCLALGGLCYTSAFLATTVACDVRYLFPVAALATVLAVLSAPPSTAGKGAYE